MSLTPRRTVVVSLSLVTSVLVFLCCVVWTACRRETRNFHDQTGAPASARVQIGDLRPAGAVAASTGAPSGYLENAYAISQGQRWYVWFNCAGCHANGGGAIGPPLMDSTWIYGSEPANIYDTIIVGRPNGMPSFRGKMTDEQVWQVVAYVRSMSGLAPSDAASGRQDHMQAKPQDQSRPPQPPKNLGSPP